MMIMYHSINILNLKLNDWKILDFTNNRNIKILRYVIYKKIYTFVYTLIKKAIFIKIGKFEINEI